MLNLVTSTSFHQICIHCHCLPSSSWFEFLSGWTSSFILPTVNLSLQLKRTLAQHCDAIIQKMLLLFLPARKVHFLHSFSELSAEQIRALSALDSASMVPTRMIIWGKIHSKCITQKFLWKLSKQYVALTCRMEPKCPCYMGTFQASASPA